MSTSNEPANDERPARGGRRRALTITAAVVAVVLLVAGFAAGRSTAPKAKQAAQPAPTVTVTVRPAVAPSPSPAASSPGAAPTASPSPGTAPSNGSTASNGTQVGSYSFKIPPNFTVPIGTKAPTQSQFSQGGVGDLSYGPGIYPVGSDKMLSLPAGEKPTYRACTADTVFAGSAASTAGTSFCLVETGRMVGVTVRSVSPTQAFIVLHAVLWTNVP
jgi:hypothetical protein